METIFAFLASIQWGLILGFLINSAGVMFLLQVLKKYRSQIKPYIPMIAPLLGAALPVIASWLSVFLGTPIDFSPIIGFFAGFSAVGLHQMVKQFGKRPRKYRGAEVRRR